MATDPLFKHFTRGLPGVEGGTTANEKFQDPTLVAAAAALRMSEDNQEGKIFLGVTGATVEIDKKEPRLPDGRTNRYAVGGTEIGIGDDRHIITVAGSRGGKGRAVLVPNLICYPGSVLVIDPKGDLAHLTAARRQQLGQTVHVLDPFGAAGREMQPYAARFNPMTILRAGSKRLFADAGMIADALIVSAPGNKDPHWDESARTLIEGLILHVATHPKYVSERNLVKVYELLWELLAAAEGMADHDDIFPFEIEMRASADEAVRHAASDFYDRADRERDSVLSTARRHLHFLGYPEMQESLSGLGSIDLRDLRRKPTTVYLSLPAMRMGSCSRWLRLFVNLVLAAMEDAAMTEETPPRYAVLMCLDEFAVLGTMKSLEDAAGQIAGLRVKLWPVLQDLGQLKALYSERWETFMGNAGVLQFFANSELTTLDWISRRLGTTSVVNQSQGNIPYGQQSAGGTGQSWAHGTAELLSVAEIARYFGRDDELLRQLIIRPTVAPVILQRAFYDKHTFFAGKFNVRPKQLGS